MQPTFSLQNTPLFVAPLAESFPAWLSGKTYSQILLITDTHTRRHCLPVLLAQTGLPMDTTVVEILPGETQKNLQTCARIWSALQQAELDRKALVINLGGGVIGDMGGFCAATWKRGVDFIQVPTTLLSMTDAAIGGKLGVDFEGIKNVIGLIRQPAAVFIDPVFLKTLPIRELHSGLAEILKHAAISRQMDAPWATQWPPNGENADAWLGILSASVAVKVQVVQEDPEEKGLRMLLNYGHTIGHAVESYFLNTAHPLTHGEAVAVGMICENHLSDTPVSEALESILIKRFRLPKVPVAAIPELWAYMQQDKKNASGKVRMALPDALPFSLKTQEISPAELEKSVAYYNTLI